MEFATEAGQSCTLVLTDPEGNQSYTIHLNKQDHNRALTDYQYAASLLQHAKLMQAAAEAAAAETAASEEAAAEEAAPEAAASKVLGQDADSLVAEESEAQNLLDNFNTSASETKWTYDATNALIASMHNYMEDFGHPKKRKHIYNNVSNDLLSQGFVHSEQSCRNKFKSLERTYKSNNDKKLKTGRGASRFFFYDKMEELLGNKPANKNNHTLESSTPSPLSVDLEMDSTLSETPPLLSPNPDESVRRGMKRKSEKEKQKQKRHEERMSIEKEKLEVEREKVKILQRLLDKMN